MKEGNSMKHGTLDGYIESLEWFYYVTNTREYGENSVKRGGWALEDTTVGHYLSEVIIADLIMKNENRIWPRYIPRIKKAVKAFHFAVFPFLRGTLFIFLQKLGLLLLLSFFIKKRCAKHNLKLSCLCPVFPHADIPMWTIYTLFF